MIRLNELPAEMFSSQILCLSPFGGAQPAFEAGLENDLPSFDIFEAFTLDGGEEDDAFHASNVDEATLFIESLSGALRPDEDLFGDLIYSSEQTRSLCDEIQVEAAVPAIIPSSLPPTLYTPLPISLELETSSPRQEVTSPFSLRISGVSLPKIAGLDESCSVQESAKRELSAELSHERATKRQRRCQPSQYVHEAETCWVCNSDKSEARKTALHRYLLKRSRRMQASQRYKYTARSAVASNRNRQKGRFVEAVQWVSLS